MFVLFFCVFVYSFYFCLFVSLFAFFITVVVLLLLLLFGQLAVLVGLACLAVFVFRVSIAFVTFIFVAFILEVQNTKHLILSFILFFIDLFILLLLDMRRDVQEIFRLTPHEKQVMMFSATLSKEMRVVCKKFMQDVIIIFFMVIRCITNFHYSSIIYI